LLFVSGLKFIVSFCVLQGNCTTLVHLKKQFYLPFKIIVSLQHPR
jgi:hypothetical protein